MRNSAGFYSRVGRGMNIKANHPLACGTRKKALLRLSIVGGLVLLAGTAMASISLVDDVADQSLNNYGFSRTQGQGATGSISIGYVSMTTTAQPRGNKDYSLAVQYNVSPTGFVYFINPLVANMSAQSVDISAYAYLAFWVRGAVGGEGFLVGLGNNTPIWFESKVQVNDWLPGGITTEWQKVIIPFEVLAAIEGNFSRATINKIVIVMTDGNLYGAAGGTVYLDDFTFGASPSSVWVDNYNDGANPNACTGNNAAYGAGYTMTYEPVSYTAQAPYVLKCDYSTATGGGTFVHVLPNGLDLRPGTHLEFDIRGLNGNETPSVRLRSNTVSYTVSLSAYATVSNTMYQKVSIPLADFTALSNLDNCDEIAFDETGGYQSAVFLDNLHFVDNSPPVVSAVPTNMTFEGGPVSNGFTINYSGTIAASADAINTDSKMEGVKFEYSPDAGTTWMTIGDDYATSDTKTNYSHYWDISSMTNGSYILRATAWHAGGSVSPALSYSVTIEYGTPTNTPTITMTPTITTTSTVSPTATPSPTITETSTHSPTATISQTATISPTITATPTITPPPHPLPEKNEVRISRNSFNPARGESLDLQVITKSQGKLQVTVYSRLGEKVVVLCSRETGPGIIPLNWDGKNSAGKLVGNGVYIIFVDGPEQQVKRLIAVIK